MVREQGQNHRPPPPSLVVGHFVNPAKFTIVRAIESTYYPVILQIELNRQIFHIFIRPLAQREHIIGVFPISSVSFITYLTSTQINKLNKHKKFNNSYMYKCFVQLESKHNRFTNIENGKQIRSKEHNDLHSALKTVKQKPHLPKSSKFFFLPSIKKVNRYYNN